MGYGNKIFQAACQELERRKMCIRDRPLSHSSVFRQAQRPAQRYVIIQENRVGVKMNLRFFPRLFYAIIC